MVAQDSLWDVRRCISASWDDRSGQLRYRTMTMHQKSVEMDQPAGKQTNIYLRDADMREMGYRKIWRRISNDRIRRRGSESWGCLRRWWWLARLERRQRINPWRIFARVKGCASFVLERLEDEN